MPEEVPHPPIADPQMAEKYVDWLTDLINQDKLEVSHSDLKKFDLSCMEDHYRANLMDYDVEISHSKHPKSGEDIYVMVFNNISRISSEGGKPVILSYAHLTQDQFSMLKGVSDRQISRRLRAEEERKFKEAMKPIDEALDQLSEDVSEKIQTEDNLPQPMELPPVPEPSKPEEANMLQPAVV